jgi:hypothetical protein
MSYPIRIPQPNLSSRRDLPNPRRFGNLFIPTAEVIAVTSFRSLWIPAGQEGGSRKLRIQLNLVVLSEGRNCIQICPPTLTG